MLSDKKIFWPVFICVAFILMACLFYAMPKVKEYYLTSGQKSITADIASRYGNYLSLSSTRLYDLAAHPVFNGAGSGLSQYEKDSAPYFSDFFLFDTYGELLGASSNRRVLPIETSEVYKESGVKGIPVPVMLTEISGLSFPAVIVPAKSAYSDPALLAGTMDSQFIKEFSSVYLSGANPLVLYIADNSGNIAPLAPMQDQQDISAPVRALLATPEKSGKRELTRGKLLLVSSSIGDTGWSIISIRRVDSVAANFKGSFLNITLFMILLSAVLLVLYYFYIKLAVKPVNNFINYLSQRFEPGENDRLGSIAAQIDSICSNMNLAESIPIGVMVVDLEGVIRFFNREAGEIIGHNPAAVTGSPMLKFFPNNYYNYTMECIQTDREYLGLRNIIKSGSFFKELLLNISPLKSQDAVTGAVATFQDVTPQRKMIEVHAAYTLARDLASQKDLDSTVKIIARAAAEMVDIENTAIFLADQEGNLLINSWYGIPESYVEKYNSAPYNIDSPEIKELYRNKTPLLHGDTRNKQNLKAMLILPGVLSFYSFPVVYEGKTIGMVNLYSQEKNKLSKDKIYLIQTLAGQVNTAITNFYEFQKMKFLASIDGLTGLLNKKYFLEKLEEEFKSASPNAPLSVSIMDLDHFKDVNDTYGHQAGDHVLMEIAGIITRSLKETDSVCRFGGEEIAISMPGTDKARAVEKIDALRIKISNTPVYQTDDGPLFITISGGVATYPGDGISLEEILQNSDSALYNAKRNGRNRVCGYHSSR